MITVSIMMILSTVFITITQKKLPIIKVNQVKVIITITAIKKITLMISSLITMLITIGKLLS